MSTQRLLLSDPMPLRTTRVLGDYSVDAPLPHRYGVLDSPFELVRLTDTEWLAADHPMSIDGVNNQAGPIQSYSVELRSDSIGNTYTVVVLSTPAAQGDIMTATGTGKQNPITGDLLENAAEIIEDILRIAGRTESWGRLRAECSAAGLVLAGSVATLDPIQTHISRVALSAGAIWIPGDGRLWPTGDIEGPILSISRTEVSGLIVSADLNDTADILRLTYGHSDDDGLPQRFIELTANPQRYGGVVLELDLPMLRTSANAEATGRRILAYLAGERYNIACTISRADTRPNQWMQLVDNPSWPLDADPVPMMALTMTIDIDEKSTDVKAIMIMGYPLISVTAHSVALASTGGEALDVSYVNGIATFRLRDKSKNPIAGAYVSLDGALAKTTDQAGTVSFATTTGTHTVALSAPGYKDQEVTVNL